MSNSSGPFRSLRPGFRAQALILRLRAAVSVGPFLTVQSVLDPQAGLCRVSADGHEGRSYIVPVDPELSDPDRARNLVEFLNAYAIAHVLSGIGDTPAPVSKNFF